MKKFAIVDKENDIAFGYEVKNKAFKKAVEIAKRGLFYWYLAGTDNLLVKNEDIGFITLDDIESFYYMGYSEPSSELLTAHGIIYKQLDLDDDKLDDFEVFEY